MSNKISRSKRTHRAEKAAINHQIEDNLILLRVGDTASLKTIHDYFDREEVLVGRLGEVWAAFWKASSERATKLVLDAKGRSSTKPFSVLAPIELLQRIIDRTRVSGKYVPLLDDRKLLLQAVSDKAFLRIPISAELVSHLAIPHQVLEEEVDDRGSFFSMHCITGQDSDYNDVQEALSPGAEVSSDREKLSLFIKERLVAITSWNESGKGSNYSDMHSAAKLAIEKKIKILLLPNELRSTAHGSYGIISLIDSEQADKMIPRRPQISKDGYWYKILRNFLENARIAEKDSQLTKNKIPAVEHSGF